MSLSHHDVLRLWERAQPLDAIGRAVALASLGDHADAAALRLGARDERLLTLLTELGAPVLEAVAACPACSEQVEVGVDAAAVLAHASPVEAVPAVRVAGHVVEVRCPDSRDLLAAGATGDVGAAAAVLLERCVVSATDPAGPIAVEELPEEVRRAVSDALAAADPLAEVLVDVTCPGCGLAYLAEIDVASIAWRAVRDRARSLMADVDALGRAYGWTEPDVLALSDTRRTAYVRLVTEGTW